VPKTTKYHMKLIHTAAKFRFKPGWRCST